MNAKTPSPRLHLIPLTPDRAWDFYCLIQEQAATHGAGHGEAEKTPENLAASQKLFDAIVRDGCSDAFLVMREDNAKAVSAVSYYNCVTPHGYGLYLEDIVTTESERKHGVGRFAMTGLAQLAAHRGGKCVVWECAQKNAKGHSFYDGIGSERCDDRHTWRLMGAIKPQAEYAFFKKLYGLTEGPVDGRNHSLVRLTVTSHNRPQILATVDAYRNFSTFRVASGMHIEMIRTDTRDKSHDPLLLAGMLEHLGAMQAEKGWAAHTDITVSQEQEAVLAPLIAKFGFEPLAYDDDRMITRRLHGKPLAALASSTHSIIDALSANAEHAKASRPAPSHLAKSAIDQQPAVARL